MSFQNIEILFSGQLLTMGHSCSSPDTDTFENKIVSHENPLNKTHFPIWGGLEYDGRTGCAEEGGRLIALGL
jgi:hypothetical protein